MIPIIVRVIFTLQKNKSYEHPVVLWLDVQATVSHHNAMVWGLQSLQTFTCSRDQVWYVHVDGNIPPNGTGHGVSFYNQFVYTHFEKRRHIMLYPDPGLIGSSWLGKLEMCTMIIQYTLFKYNLWYNEHSWTFMKHYT